MARTWTADLDFSAGACHVEGCDEPPATYWRSCYADTLLCGAHEAEMEAVVFYEDDDETDFSCCWYPFAWRVPRDDAGEV